MMYYHRPEDRGTKELLPGIIARTYWGERMLAAVVDLNPNTELPLHSHTHEQIGIVIQGRIEFNVAGEVQVLKPGDVYVIPGGVEHGARTFDDPVQVMDIFSPVREEYKY
jgi:quercetin dioxygenase-like cupin family protein